MSQLTHLLIQKMASAVMYEVEQMPGIIANRCVEIL